MRYLFIFFLFFSVENNGQSASKAVPSVPAPGFSLAANINVVTPLSPVTVHWNVSKTETTDSDWIGLFPMNTPSDSSNEIWSQKTHGIVTGDLDARVPLSPGNYEFRYFSGSDYHKMKGASPAVLVIHCSPFQLTRSKIKHVVLIVQENHSFDSIFGNYCKAPTGSNPQCNMGAECCEAGPQLDPGSLLPHVTLTDGMNAFFGPSHGKDSELSRMNQGKMNRYVILGKRSFMLNFAYADQKTAAQYWDYAQNYSMSDRYFQSIAGASSANDMYLARASYVFDDDNYAPAHAVGVSPHANHQRDFLDPNIGDMMRACHVPFAIYAGRYAATKSGSSELPLDCKPRSGVYPCNYDPTDIPFEYYPNIRGQYMKDLDNDFTQDLATGNLPAFSFIKNVAYKNEHPGSGVTITVGSSAVNEIVQQVLSSPYYRENTLILFTYDEGGGYFDHISPPANSEVDHQPYGVRIPFVAIGQFAKKNYVSHVQMEHASVVKFIEWNWFPGQPGQLNTRDAVVNSIGSLLDPEKTGTQVP